MKKKELKDRAALLEIELVALRDQMRILVEKTDSPEAAAIKLQWQFAKEIEKAYESGKPVDTPKLMGLYGQMMNPTLNKLTRLPKTEEELKEVLGSFYRWLYASLTEYGDGKLDLLKAEVMQELLNVFIDKLKKGYFG